MQSLSTMQQKLNQQNGKTGALNPPGAAATSRPVASSIRPNLAVLDPTEMGAVANNLERTLRHAITGHDAAIHEIVKVYQTHLAGLCPAGRPIGTFLFLGPSCSERQQTVEAVADALLGSPNAIVRINCLDFRHSHDITKLIGTPRGYPAHRQTQALLTQEFLNQHHTNSLKLSVLLFDQVESAAAALWNRLLGILDTGALKLGDNREVDFSRALIFMTSTIGGAEINSPFGRKLRHFPAPVDDPDCTPAMRRPSYSRVGAARQRFTPESLNRLNRIEVFRVFGENALDRIVDAELEIVQERTSTANKPFRIDVTESARQFLLSEGADFRCGAPPVKRAIERLLVRPLSNLITTGQVHTWDRIRIAHIGAAPTLTFFREEDAWEEWMIDGAVA
jgi:ATP-dependent Clp protease ATP-binding subunit ClpB